MSAPRRIFKVSPGFDCKNAPCQHEKKGDHGIHGDEWIYVVTDGEVAVNLTIMTDRFPPTVPPFQTSTLVRNGTMASDLGCHSAWPLYEGEWESGGCAYIDGPTCFYDGSGMRAEEFWTAWGNPEQPEQGEPLWGALECEWASQAAEARQRRASKQQEEALINRENAL